MKKLFLSLAAVAALAFGANAQTEQGNMMLGGDLSFTTAKPALFDGNYFSLDVTDPTSVPFYTDGDASSTTFSVVPSFGYFISDNLALGLGVGYSSSTFKLDSDNKANYGEFKVAPFGRYYVDMGDQFKFFGQLQVGLGFGSYKVTAAGTESDLFKSSNLGVALSPGFAFFPSDNFAIELSFAGIQYNSYTIKPEGGGDDLKNNNFQFGFNTFMPKLGANFFF